MSASPTAAPAQTFDRGRSGQVFARAKAEGRGALVAFLHVRYPDVTTSLAAMRALTGQGDGPGVDLVEVGLPYSDPMMDGVTIQRAGTRALARGVRTLDAFTAVEALADAGTPAVVMTYWNLVEHYGADAFAQLADWAERVKSSTEFSMVPYRVADSLSEHGGVSRAVLEVNHRGWLDGIQEVLEIRRRIGGRREPRQIAVRSHRERQIESGFPRRQ